MPIIRKEEPKPKKAVGDEVRQSVQQVHAKKEKRTKFHKIRKDRRTPEEYNKMKMVVDGEEKEISNSSKFLLDMLITDED